MFARVCLASSLCLAAGVASAQVLAIGGSGAVTVYDGPAVFTDHGATPIPKASPPHRRGLPRAAGREALTRAADAAALSPALIEAVAWQESRGRADRVSRAGAVGKMQLMPATARGLGVDAADPDQNLSGGAAYLSGLMRRYDGDLVRTLAAYNAGPGAIARFGGVPPYRETRAYVAAVLDRLSQAVVPLPAGPMK